MKITFQSKNLLEASDYRSFLKIFYIENKQIDKNFSYSFIAQKCQFSSKSFVKDVIDGRKNLSLDSAHKIATGLQFPQLWKNYFINLFQSTLVEPNQINLVQIKELDRIKSKLISKTKTIENDRGVNNIFQHAHWPFVYASLGTLEKGSDIETMMSRTKLPRLEIEEILQQLIQLDLVVSKKNKYYCVQNSAFFENLGKSSFYKNFFRQSVQQLYAKADKNFESDADMFYSLAFSVNSKKMPVFKKELAELIDKYTTSIEEAEGDRIALITCGLHLT
jgi:uncharacterized protein (TIGR02147 family)